MIYIQTPRLILRDWQEEDFYHPKLDPNNLCRHVLYVVRNTDLTK